MVERFHTITSQRATELLTVDNGGTSTRMAILGHDGTIKNQVSYKTPPNYDDAVEQYGKVTRSILGTKKPDALGISIAGAVEQGQIVSAGQLEAYGWTGKSFVDDVSEAVGVSTEKIAFLNDCAAGARAEQQVRKLADSEMGMFAVQSTGIGNAFYDRGSICPDEMGHQFLREGGFNCPCGKENCMEAYTGGVGIRMNYGVAPEDIPHEDQRWRQIKTDFHTGVEKTLKRSDVMFGMAAVRVIGFTGGVVENGPNMLGNLQKYLTYKLGKKAPTIDKAVFGEQSGLYGAAFAARDLIET